MMKTLKHFDRDLVILFVIILIVIFIFIYMFVPTLKAQSLNSNSYYNYLFLSFLKAKGTHKIHDANVLKTLLLVQENPAAKIKLGKLCTKFIEDEGLKDK